MTLRHEIRPPIDARGLKKIKEIYIAVGHSPMFEKFFNFLESYLTHSKDNLIIN